MNLNLHHVGFHNVHNVTHAHIIYDITVPMVHHRPTTPTLGSKTQRYQTCLPRAALTHPGPLEIAVHMPGEGSRIIIPLRNKF